MMPPNHETDPASNSNEPANNNSSEIWWDKQQVMQFLPISERTLQYWRAESLIVYSQVRGKIFYNKRDVLAMLENGKVKAVKKKRE